MCCIPPDPLSFFCVCFKMGKIKLNEKIHTALSHLPHVTMVVIFCVFLLSILSIVSNTCVL